MIPVMLRSERVLTITAIIVPLPMTPSTMIRMAAAARITAAPIGPEEEEGEGVVVTLKRSLPFEEYMAACPATINTLRRSVAHMITYSRRRCGS